MNGVEVQPVWSHHMLLIPHHSSPMPPCLSPLRSLPSTNLVKFPTPQLTLQLDHSVRLPPLTLTLQYPVQCPLPTAPTAPPWPLLLPLIQHRMVIWSLQHLLVSQGTQTAAHIATAPWRPRLHPVCQRNNGSMTHQKTW